MGKRLLALFITKRERVYRVARRPTLREREGREGNCRWRSILSHGERGGGREREREANEDETIFVRLNNRDSGRGMKA